MHGARVVRSGYLLILENRQEKLTEGAAFVFLNCQLTVVCNKGMSAGHEIFFDVEFHQLYAS